MKVHETRHAHASGSEERKMTRKQKAAEGGEAEESQKKPKVDGDDDGENENGEASGKSIEEIKAEFERFCRAMREHLTIQQMRQILEANGQDPDGDDDAVVPRCQDVIYHGPLADCPVCGGRLEYTDSTYVCTGTYSEWSSCIFNTMDPPRREEPLNLPDSVMNSSAADMLQKHQDPKSRTRTIRNLGEQAFKGMIISLAGRLTRTHQYYKTKIEKSGGKVANSVMGATCLVVSPAERERGGSSKLAEAVERGIPVVREGWIVDSLENGKAQPLGMYDLASTIAVAGGGIPLYQQDPTEEAVETLTAELKVFGKRGVHKDAKLIESGAQILEKDGILYNCAFTVSDKRVGLNDFCIIQLIELPDDQLYMYYKKGKIGDIEAQVEILEEWKDVDDATREFAEHFEALTGNKFEPWEREKIIQKKNKTFFPVDMDDGVEVRHGGLGLRQLGAAAAHCKLHPKVGSFMKVLCGQEIYRYALMEMGLDFPELPIGMVTDLHLKRCEDVLLGFAEKLKLCEPGPKRDALWCDLSQRIFTFLPSTRPYVFRDFSDIADHGVAALEMVRDINVASRVIGDVSGATLDDPLFETYKKLGCSISALEKDKDDYKMIANYLEKTYEPIRVGEISYGVSIEDVFAVELSAGPSPAEMKNLPNKYLLWCGTKSSNLVRHLHKGFLPATCFVPVPGYMFGKAIVCSDTAAEAARYGYTAVDRPEGYLILAVASLGENVIELTKAPENSKELEEKKKGVIGLGRKKTDESEHFVWKDNVKVPCGRLMPSEYTDSPLEYNEYAVYDPQQVCIRFLVGVKFEEKGVHYDTAEP